MWNLFRRKPKVIPQPGTVWWLKCAVNDGNPFRRKIPAVEVIEVRSGWVNYRMLPKGGLFQDESLKLDSFLYCYTPKP